MQIDTDPYYPQHVWCWRQWVDRPSGDDQDCQVYLQDDGPKPDAGSEIQILYIYDSVISSPNVKILVSDWAVPGQYWALIGCRLTSSTHPRGELTTSSGGWTSTATGSSPDRSYSVPSGALSSSMMNITCMKDPWNIYIVTSNTGVCERLPQRHKPAAAPGPRHAVSRYSVDSL